MRGSSLALTLFLGLVASGCKESDTVLEATDYQTTCVEDCQCVVVNVGDICTDPCREAAINVADLEAYRRDRDAIECPDRGGTPTVMLCGGGSTAVCLDGRCALYEP